MLYFAVASSWGLGDSTVFIFVLCTKAVSSSPPYAASQSPVSLPLPLLFSLSFIALLGWLFSELGGQRYGLSQKEALFLWVWGWGTSRTVFMFVLAWLQGQWGSVGRASLVPVSLAPPVQGVQSRPFGPRVSVAPLCSRVESRVGGDATTAPPSSQTPLVIRGSIWKSRKSRQKLNKLPSFMRCVNTQLSQSLFLPSRSICGGMPFCRCNLLPKPPSTSSSTSCSFSWPSWSSSSFSFSSSSSSSSTE